MIKVLCDHCHEAIGQFSYNSFTIKYTVVNVEKNAREPRVIEKQICDKCISVVINKIESILQGEAI